MNALPDDRVIIRKYHPETRDGELFLCNGDLQALRSESSYKSLRAGNTAYDNYGAPIESWELSPIFVSEEEVITLGFTVMTPLSLT